MIYYTDLLNLPYKPHGRDTSGMDCYGLVIECCKRAGTPLKDVYYKTDSVSKEKLAEYVPTLNVVEREFPKTGYIIQCTSGNNLHIGYLVDSTMAIHTTEKGVRLTPLNLLKNKKYYEVLK